MSLEVTTMSSTNTTIPHALECYLPTKWMRRKLEARPAFPQDVQIGTEGKQEATNHLIRWEMPLLADTPHPELSWILCVIGSR